MEKRVTKSYQRTRPHNTFFHQGRWVWSRAVGGVAVSPPRHANELIETPIVRTRDEVRIGNKLARSYTTGGKDRYDTSLGGRGKFNPEQQLLTRAEHTRGATDALPQSLATLIAGCWDWAGMLLAVGQLPQLASEICLRPGAQANGKSGT
uniref:Uncharacterized protein n=1 Tax=Anopheles coluzzii TaxID=1518534 RepID=A0A8W7P9X7_ANOCL